jgi:hypothetical protein
MAATAPATTANAKRYRRISGSFTRPSNTTAYAAGDLVANSATAASVAPLSWVTAGSQPFDIPEIRVHKTGAPTATLRCRLFTSSPTVDTTGDNGVFADNVNGAATCFAIYEGVLYPFKDGATGFLVPISGVIRLDYVGDPTTVYGLLEAVEAFTPISAEVFTVTPHFEFLP